MNLVNVMKAITQREYGSPSVLQFGEADVPAMGDGEVLVRVHAASINPLDWHRVVGTPYLVRIEGGVWKPKLLIPGVDMAGRVEAVGREVTRFQPGDEVFGMRDGAFAEYVSAREDLLVSKPASVTFAQAAAVPIAALTALQGLRNKGRIQAGQKVLINGASGGVGTFAVQLAKYFGAEVTAVCSTRNVDMVRKLGADRVIDYTTEDFTRTGQRYDLVLDTAGNRSVRVWGRVLSRGGSLVAIGGPKTSPWLGPLPALVTMLVVARFTGRRMVAMLAKNNREDLAFLVGLVASGDVTPVIERTYQLHEVPDALRYLGEGHARGKLVITVHQEQSHEQNHELGHEQN